MTSHPTHAQPHHWQVWIDTGGTFTDCLAVPPSDHRSLVRAKVLSSSIIRTRITGVTSDSCLVLENPQPDRPGDWLIGMTVSCGSWSARVTGISADPLAIRVDCPPDECRAMVPGLTVELSVPSEPAPILAARLVTGTPAGRRLPPIRMRLATTRGTNALLQRRGVPTALFITRGFGDLLRIGTQQRPDLFALDIRKPEPLYSAVVEVPERLAADGSVLLPIDLDPVRAAALRLLDRDIRTAAVALMHSTFNPAHELAVAACLRDAGFAHVSMSHDVAPMIRLLHRAETTVVNATLSPLMEQYLYDIEHTSTSGACAGAVPTLHVMTSTGGLTGSASYRARDSLLSGPAGGVAGALASAIRSGHSRVISFDMGGTSTDVSRIDGDLEYVFEHTVGDAHLFAPALAIETVAAGGGSICWFDGQALRVGPDSAGAEPGPACYDRSGPLTITDVNLMLGRLDPHRFGLPINKDAARERLNELLNQLAASATAGPQDETAILNGFVDIANERMANAIRKISAQRGYDPAEYALLAFGGAGGQHACGVASRLGITKVIIPADAGLLSAYGLGQAVIERVAERQLLTVLDAESAEALVRIVATLGDKASAAVRAECEPGDDVAIRRCIVNMRLVGQNTPLTLDVTHDDLDSGTLAHLKHLFCEAYIRTYGHSPPSGRAVELESVRVIASTMRLTGDNGAPPDGPVVRKRDGQTRASRAYFNGEWCDVPAIDRDEVAPGTEIPGPALILEAHASTVVEPGWSARIDHAGAIVLDRSATGCDPAGVRSASSAEIGPVELELFTCRFESLADEMGELLRRTAVSVNVKERLDFSCALLDPDGQIVANAKHIPVHLGSLGLCVRTVREHVKVSPGDVIMTNHPAFGGSHLPDITIITPIYDESDVHLLGYAASRAHHAEVGGIAPGSMPPAATTLQQEGVILNPMHLTQGGGEPNWPEIERLMTSAAPYPTRSVQENLADLSAAVAANHRGAAALRHLASLHGVETIRSAMRALKRKSEQCVRHALAARMDGRYMAEELLDCGTPIRVTIDIHGTEATIDFTGTGDTHPGNLNATPAIVHSAIIYVLRLLINEPLPLNEGFMSPVTVILPTGCLLNPLFDTSDPSACPAVAGGNVETSQRLVDALIRALGLAAGSQGTMNNVVFGNDRFGYYETICGGSGAGPGFDGADAVHTHMTNTCITDPEVVEHRYPVRIERFGIRRDSGGSGQFCGGDGVIREFLFLEPVSLSVLTQHRVAGPYGMAGGQSGWPGLQYVTRVGVSGQRIELSSIDGCDLNAGDRFTIMTPGGGGWGKPEDRCST